jgi:hypothetical protein
VHDVEMSDVLVFRFSGRIRDGYSIGSHRGPCQLTLCCVAAFVQDFVTPGYLQRYCIYLSYAVRAIQLHPCGHAVPLPLSKVRSRAFRGILCFGQDFLKPSVPCPMVAFKTTIALALREGFLMQLRTRFVLLLYVLMVMNAIGG